MIYIKTFEAYITNFKLDDLYESMSMWYQNILNSIGADEVNFAEVFETDEKMNKDLEILDQSSEFIKILNKQEMRKDPMENTENFETFLNKPCRYILIYNRDANSLENPLYILFQTWNETLNKWDDTKAYKVNSDIKKFYDKLSSKTLEVISNGVKYIYQTSNANEWILKNQNETDVFKKYMRSEDFEEMIKNNDVKVNIV